MPLSIHHNRPSAIGSTTHTQSYDQKTVLMHPSFGSVCVFIVKTLGQKYLGTLKIVITAKICTVITILKHLYGTFIDGHIIAFIDKYCVIGFHSHN